MAVTEADGSMLEGLDISSPPYCQPEDEDVASQLQRFVETLEAALRE